MQSHVELLFALDVGILIALVIGTIWSVAFPAKRIWPPPGRRSWQHRLAWIGFYLVFTMNAALVVLDWNSWLFESNLRFIVGVPLALTGALLVSWGVASLGAGNTSGLKEGFVSSGPYRFTRNPQYLGDMILFVGLSVIANSLFLWITHILMIIVFAITPLAEEIWLEEQYGEPYIEYKRGTSRFL
jgi:protein-S-isoprenylcysteine O-methyltransferase Ste14